jgi:hypothetical protein
VGVEIPGESAALTELRLMVNFVGLAAGIGVATGGVAWLDGVGAFSAGALSTVWELVVVGAFSVGTSLVGALVIGVFSALLVDSLSTSALLVSDGVLWAGALSTGALSAGALSTGARSAGALSTGLLSACAGVLSIVTLSEDARSIEKVLMTGDP